MEGTAWFLLLSRIKKIFAKREMANYKLPISNLTSLLYEHFWDEAGGLDGFVNRLIYRRAVEQLNKAKRENDHTNETCRNNLKAILDNRTKEIIVRLTDTGYLVKNNDTPPQYYISTVSAVQFLYVFRWVIVKILLLGLVVAIVANLLSNVIWEHLQ